MPSFQRFHRIVVLTLTIIAFAACNDKHSPGSGGAAPVLLFSGAGTSSNDVAALQNILNKNQLGYVTINSSQLNELSQPELSKYRLLIVPGGNFITMGNSLTHKTAGNIRQAVQQGLNYLGICAGAFLAGNSSYYSGFNLTHGVAFNFYSAENKGVRKAALTITSAGTKPLDQYWEDGPQLSNWGKVVAKYPDGTPAVAEGTSGRGFVLLAGIHAEAAADWRRNMRFNTPVKDDNEVALSLIRAALKGSPLPYY